MKTTEETKEKIRLSYQNKSDLYKYNKRKALSENEENNKRLREFNKKRSIKVKCFDRYTDELIGVFESMSEASRKTGVNLKCMWESLKKGKYAKGKYFEYV